jgi:hypothetical protein
MLTRTEAFLRAAPEVWDDGYLAFGWGANVSGVAGLEAVLAFFGSRRVAPALSGLGEHEVLLTGDALREIDEDAGRRALVQLLRNDLRMFSIREVDPAVLQALAGVFFEEMGRSRIYSNTFVYPAGSERGVLGPLSSVTRHTVDTFLCAVNEACVAYWLYADDE